MSRENVETLRRGYEAFNRRNIDAWLDALDADVEAQDLPSIPDAPIRRGHAALREWVSMMDDIWVDGRYEPQEFIEGAGPSWLPSVPRAVAGGAIFRWMSRCSRSSRNRTAKFDAHWPTSTG